MKYKKSADGQVHTASFSRGYYSDFAKWNRLIFGDAKKSSHLVLKKGFKVTNNVSRIVRNVVNSSSIKSTNKCSLNAI